MIVPAGIITIWSGAIIDIPAGWILCNGNNGSPDLRDRFVVGAGSSYAVGATGGANYHSHAFDSEDHHHDIVGAGPVQGGTDLDSETSEDPATGNTGSGDSRPPYYALCYIMRLGA